MSAAVPGGQVLDSGQLLKSGETVVSLNQSIVIIKRLYPDTSFFVIGTFDWWINCIKTIVRQNIFLH